MSDKRWFLLLIAAGLQATGIACTAGDDDTTSDDDDSTPPGDDDDTTGDDDVSDDDDDTASFDDCVGAPITVAEIEPNDGESDKDIHIIEEADGDVLITGIGSVCSNDGDAWTGDVDSFVVGFNCGGTASVNLTWHGGVAPGNATDYDLIVADGTSGDVIGQGFEFQEANDPPEESVANFAWGGPLYVQVLCWSGPSDEYALHIDWQSAPDPTGDDDDTVGDDDVGPDDDDSAGGPSATLRGTITRSASLSGDGIGTIYLTVSDPDLGGGPQSIAAEGEVVGADLSGDSASVAFEVRSIPPKATPYTLELFLDDDGSGAGGGPSTGDLTVAVFPTFTAATVDVFTLDVVLDTRR